jgi:hypothetical protein
MASTANAAQTTKGPRVRLAASLNTTKRDDVSTSIGGISNFDTNNRFRYYQQLQTASPYVSFPLLKLGLMLTKGVKADGKKAILKDFGTMRKKSNLDEQLSTMARLLGRDGTLLGRANGDENKFYFYPALMPYTTLLPEGVKPKSKPTEIMQPPLSTVVLNEGAKNQNTEDLDKLILGNLHPWDYVQEDVKKRETFGIYGSSLLDPIELSIRNLLNINKGYVSFVKRYGMGRYHYDHVMLEKLVEAEVLTPEQAGELHDEWLEDNKNLQENEDISAIGLKITPVDAKGSLNVMDFKESLETEIQLALFQSPLTMGKASGTTYASGYLVEEDRLVVLEGLQKITQNVAQEFVNKWLEVKNKPADSIEIKFEELSKIKLTASEVQEMFNTGVIERDEFRNWGGFYLVNGEEAATA